MNELRMTYLLQYMDALSKLTYEGSFLCNKEITECIGWIREEFTKEPIELQDIVMSKGFTGFIDKGRNGE